MQIRHEFETPKNAAYTLMHAHMYVHHHVDTYAYIFQAN